MIAMIAMIAMIGSIHIVVGMQAAWLVMAGHGFGKFLLLKVTEIRWCM